MSTPNYVAICALTTRAIPSPSPLNGEKAGMRGEEAHSTIIDPRTIALTVTRPEMEAVSATIHAHCHGRTIEEIEQDTTAVLLVRIFNLWKQSQQ